MSGKVLILASVASMIDQFNIPNIKLLIEMGFTVEVACNFLSGNTCSDEKIQTLKTMLDKMGVKIYQIDFARDAFKLSQNLRAYRQVLEIMTNNRYEFIHCHSPIGGLCGRLAGHKTKTKVIYTAHGFHFYKGAPFLNWLVYYPIEKFLSRYTDVLITINKEDFARAKTFHARKVEYVPGVGIDIDKIQAVTVDRTKKRKELGIPDDAFLFISVGELNRNKNHEIVIRALSMLDANDNLYYIIAGTGPLKGHLQSLIKKSGLSSRIQLLGYRTDVVELLKISDCFVFPSKREGLPVALMEAMAASLPIVCSDIRGNIDLIEDAVNGYLFKNTDTNSLIVCMEKVFMAKEKYSKRFMDRIKSIGQGVILARMKEIYRDVLKGRNYGCFYVEMKKSNTKRGAVDNVIR